MKNQYNLLHRNLLLEQLATKLKKFDRGYKIFNLEVKFYCDAEVVKTTDVLGALDILAYDLYYDVGGDWSLANRLEIVCM